VSTLNKEVIA